MRGEPPANRLSLAISKGTHSFKMPHHWANPIRTRSLKPSKGRKTAPRGATPTQPKRIRKQSTTRKNLPLAKINKNTSHLTTIHETMSPCKSEKPSTHSATLMKIAKLGKGKHGTSKDQLPLPTMLTMRTSFSRG